MKTLINNFFIVYTALVSATLFFSVLVVVAKNPIVSVFSLIAVFVFSASALLLVGAEFLAFVYVLVYVGAVLILFLWVVMTVPVKKNPMSHPRFSVLFVFISICFMLFVFSYPFSSGVFLIPVRPDNLFFPIFFKTIRNFNFNFVFTPSLGSPSREFLSLIVPDPLINVYFQTKVNVNSVFYNAFVLQHIMSGKVFLVYPFTPESYFGVPAASIFKNFDKLILTKMYVLGVISYLNNSAVYFSLADLAQSSNLFFLLPRPDSTLCVLDNLFPPRHFGQRFLWFDPWIFRFAVDYYMQLALATDMPTLHPSLGLAELSGLIVPDRPPFTNYVWFGSYTTAKRMCGLFNFYTINSDVTTLHLLLFGRRPTFFEWLQGNITLFHRDVLPFLTLNSYFQGFNQTNLDAVPWLSILNNPKLTFLDRLSAKLYSFYGFPLFCVSVILLISMVGSVSLVKSRGRSVDSTHVAGGSRSTVFKT